MEPVARGTRVLLFAEYGQMGGTRTYFKQLLGLYWKHGCAATIVRTYEEPDADIDSLIAEYGFRCIDIGSIYGRGRTRGNKFPFNLLVERRVLSRLIERIRPDIVVASVGTPGLFVGALGWAKRSLYILHTYPMAAAGFRRWKEWVKQWIYGRIFRANTHLVTVSEFSRCTAVKVWGIKSQENVHVVYSTTGDIVPARNTAVNHSSVVLTVGHVIGYKNPNTWIDVAKTILETVSTQAVRFVWVGDGALLGACRERVRDLGLEGRVTFVGWKDAVESYYKECDIYFQPSLIESLGLGCLDALRYGKPCVVSNRGGLPEVVQDDICGFVMAPDDVAGMADVLGRLLRDESLYQAMSTAAANQYANRFSYGAWESNILALHRTACNNSVG